MIKRISLRKGNLRDGCNVLTPTYLYSHLFLVFQGRKKKHQLSNLSNHSPKEFLDNVQDAQWGTQTVEGVSDFFGFNLRGESVVDFFGTGTLGRYQWKSSETNNFCFAVVRPR